ncbi:cation:proton antiporter [Neisseria meningitidis]
MGSLFLPGGALLFLSVVSTTLSARLGMPLLLVSPANVLDGAAEALAIAAFLMLVARPPAVFGGLWKFNYSLREKAYISWLGLAGAVPISPVMMPPVTGVPNSHLLFDVAFAVVVLSLLIRGMTIPVMARLLKVAMPNKPEPKDTHDIWLAKKEIVRMSAFKVVAESEAEGHHPDTVEPISDSFGARCFALIRNGIRIEMQSDTVLQAGIWRGTSCPTARSI